MCTNVPRKHSSPREIKQWLLLLRAHQIVNEKTLTLNKGSTREEK